MMPLLYRRGKAFFLPSSKSDTNHLAFWVVFGTLIGGILAALVAFEFQEKDLSLGLFFGCLVASLNFLGLNSLTQRVLKAGGAKGQKLFGVWNVVRWLGFALAFWWLLSVSRKCLLGGLVGYFWFLIVLTWTSLRLAYSKK
jgi:hypothetical protein